MSALTDWSDGEITELMAERDAAVRERDEALRQLESSRLCVRSLTDTKQAVAEMRAAANDAMTEVQRDAALTILRDMTSWDGVDDFDCEIIVPPARKLLGDI